ncbi:MAG TPA: acetyltransferase [Syntrophorhabdaceae bacterium]|nr:acetyltransferase [Syntrophorhabdaceae bacterium]
MRESVIVIGAGGHAKVVVSTLIAAGVEVSKIYDDHADKWKSSIFGIPIVGPLSDIGDDSSVAAITAIGDNKTRKRVVARFPHLRWIAVVHPAAYVHPNARIGQGTVVFAKAVVQPDAVIGDHCIVNTGATVDHDCRIGNYVHISPGVNLAGDVQLLEGVFCGIGSKVINGITVGRWSSVGAGGVVVSDLPDASVAVGVPAKVIARAEADEG